MKATAKFEALIFDFNGVLLWDDRLQRGSWLAFAALLRPEPLSDQELLDIVYTIFSLAHGLAILQLTKLVKVEFDYDQANRTAFKTLLAGFAL